MSTTKNQKEMATKTIQSLRDSLERGVRVNDLTERQAVVLTYILQCWMSGFLPTVREICTELDIASTNGVAGHLHALRVKEYLLEGEDAKSGLMLSDKALELVL